MKKEPFVTKEQIEEIVKTYPTPFHLYDEKGIRENAKAVKEAFAWNPGFREYFAVKATPNPFILNILKGDERGYDPSDRRKIFCDQRIGKSRRLWRKGTGSKGNRGSSCCGRKTKRNRENIFRSL